MSTSDDYDCNDGAAVTARCDVCIDQLIVIGTEVLDALTGPVERALAGFSDAGTTLNRRLKWGARKQLEGIEATAVALGPMPALSGAAGEVDGHSPLADMGEVSAPAAPEGAFPSVDWDQPHVLLFDERAERWHAQMSAYYSGTLSPLLSAPSWVDYAAQRDLKIAELIANDPPEYHRFFGDPE